MKIDLMGQKFGRLIVIGIHSRTDKNLYWLCQCECGKIRRNAGYLLRKGIVNSCGCYHRDLITKHGDSSHYLPNKKVSTEYFSWESMKARCFNPKNQNFCRYGGRGITVCERWKSSYSDFLKDMGRKPFPSATIDRINNDGNYEPSNCRWASKKEQSANKRQRTIYGGKLIKRFQPAFFGLKEIL